MARILLVQRDTLLATALEDDLRDAGHAVTWIDESTAAVDRARREGVDAVVIESASQRAALDTVRAFRALEETHRLPVVLIAPDGGSRPRLAALKAGASDVVERPFEPEELLLRLERLVGTASAPALAGDLATHPLAELVQYIQHTGQDGELTVHAGRGAGRVRFIRGRAVAASCGELTAGEAMLALLGAEEGRFNFVARDPEDDATETRTALPLVRLLLLSGWLADQLELRRRWLPVTGEPLRLTGEQPPEVEGDFAELPIAEVIDELGSNPGSRLYDLLEVLPAAGRKVRLTVTWLIEHGVVVRGKENQAFPTTREIDGAVLCEGAVEQLAMIAAKRGFDSSAPFLLLAESAAWTDLLTAFGSLPKAPSTAPFARLGEQLAQRRGGSVTVESARGRLSLHVQELVPDADGGRRLQIGSLVPACAGMLIWLHAAAAEEAVRAAVEQLEEMDGYPAGVLVVGQVEAESLAERLTAVNRRWTMTRHEPKSLLAVLRLLRGQA